MDRFDAMQAFARVVETGSFTKAAETLHLSKTTVTQLVQQLGAPARQAAEPHDTQGQCNHRRGRLLPASVALAGGYRGCGNQPVQRSGVSARQVASGCSQPDCQQDSGAGITGLLRYVP